MPLRKGGGVPGERRISVQIGSRCGHLPDFALHFDQIENISLSAIQEKSRFMPA
jgi:hypothetical protein